eukprot:GSMAST32.ASY1.ANO1.1710.1 assembled CDS
MSLAMDLQLEVRKMPGNKVCADCPARNPQWASVSHGTLICLECSGKHRSLGVHISFVRSLQMDSWNEKQIKSLKYGGNKKLNKFLKAHGVPVEKLSIKEKYDNPTAEAFRERISARISGDKDYSSIEIPIDWASNLASKASERARAAAGVVKSATSTQESTPTLYRREGVSDFPKLYNRDLNNTKHGQMGKVMTGIGGGGDGISNSEGIDSKNMKKYSKNGVKKPNHNSVKSAWLDSSNDTWGDDFGWDDMEDIDTNKKGKTKKSLKSVASTGNTLNTNNKTPSVDKIQSTNSSTKSIKTKKIKKKGKKRPSNLTSSSSSTGHGHMVKSPRCARNTKSFMEDDFFSDVHLASSLSESMNDLNTTQTTRNMHEKKKQIMDTEDDFFNSDW